MKDKELPLRAKIEQIIRQPTISKKSVSEIIEKIYTSEEHNLFFSRIRESETHKKLFFLHRFDLFGEAQFIPYFYLANIPKRGKYQEKALQYVISKEVVVRDSEDYLLSFLGLPEPHAKEFGEDFKDILAYFTILFIRSNEDLVNLINAEEFDYKTMKSILKNYENISFDVVERQLSEVFKGERGELDPVIRSKIEKLISQIISGLTGNIVRFVESSRKMMPNMMLPFHKLSRMWLLTILTKARLDIKEYVNILDDLHIHKLIENISTVFWCENCSLENPSYSEYHGRIGPSKIARNKCLNCGRTQSYSSIFSLDELLKDAIFSKDGFIAVYFGWLLKREKIPFNVGEYFSEYENDFIINNNTLVECKMFKLEKDRIAIKSELENSIKQIREHLDTLNQSGKQIKHAYLIWNRYESPKELIDRIIAKYRLEEYNFEVFGPDDMEELISKLKRGGRS